MDYYLANRTRALRRSITACSNSIRSSGWHAANYARTSAKADELCAGESAKRAGQQQQRLTRQLVHQNPHRVFIARKRAFSNWNIV